LRNGATRRGHSPEGGGDGGDARTESSTKKGLRWRKTGEVDVWATGDECAALRRGQTRQTTRGGGGENFQPAGGGSILRGAVGRGARRRGCRMEVERERETGVP
jgi:hypothetical protein